jgi:hypothetical protein
MYTVLHLRLLTLARGQRRAQHRITEAPGARWRARGRARRPRRLCLRDSTPGADRQQCRGAGRGSGPTEEFPPVQAGFVFRLAAIHRYPPRSNATN